MKPSKPVTGRISATAAAPLDCAVPVEDCVALPVVSDPAADDVLADVPALVVSLPFVSPAPLLVGVPVTTAPTTPYQPSPHIHKSQIQIHTIPNIPNQRKLVLSQTRRPTPQIPRSTTRPHRRHKHSGVTIPLIAEQRRRLRKQRAGGAGGPEDAGGAGPAALCEGGGGGEGEGVVAGALVGNYIISRLLTG